MKRIVFYIALLFSLLVFSCGEKNPVTETEFNVSGIVLPQSVDVESGGAIELKVVGSRGPAETDLIRLLSVSGEHFDCAIEGLSAKSFSFTLPETFTAGKYDLLVVRGDESKKIGSLHINIIYPQREITPEEGSTVYGFVHCNDRPLQGVVVSDGYQVTCTDEYGVYQLKSEKKHGYVFVSSPSGYTVQTDGTLPLFHQYVTKDSETPERLDFALFEDGGQDKHTMVVLGDIHLANRNNDVTQFLRFINDLNTYMSDNSGKKFYGLTLGDMSWDQYWITNGYDLSNYLNDISKLRNIAVYNTIGNHDHEQMAAGDFHTVAVYKRIVGPTYYSFNLGKVHYVVLDDIECTNKGDGARTYNNKLVQEQIDWLAKDLSYVSADTPVVVSMHAPVYKANGDSRLSNSDKLVSALGDRKVHYMTGHTHVMYNVVKGTHYEHNSGAVCATWWWTDYETPGIHISQDGTPGGYRLLEVDGTDFKWIYKPTGKSVTHQFRTYDRNRICMTAAAYVPDANASNSDSFMKAAAAYSTVSDANEVIINVWDYDPDWKIEVKENGVLLDVKRISGNDPLHLVAYSAKRLGKNKTATFLTESTSHLFKVVAGSATSTLEIKVTDCFGREYTETMTRPKDFEISNYK